MTDGTRVVHSVGMDRHANRTGWKTMYSLWHLPSSTLLLATVHAGEVGQRVQGALADGIPVDDLMLEVTSTGELVGRQHLGARIADALGDLLEPPDIAFRGA